MSGIESVKIYQNNSQAGLKAVKKAHNPSFSGSVTQVAEKLEEAAVANYTGIEKSLGRMGKITAYLNKKQGEVQTQLMNAIFTATLAPAFIAFNPLSKEDKATKEYTALRQPISAVTAILFSLGLTMPANNFLEAMGSKGLIRPINLRTCPNENYLGRVYDRAKKSGKFEQLKKDTPNWSGDFSKESYVKIRQTNAKKLFTKLIHEDPAKLRGDANLQKEVRDLDGYIKGNNLHEVSFRKFMKNKCGVRFFSDAEGGGIKDALYEKQLNETKAMDFLRKAGLVDKNFQEEDLRAYLSKKRGNALRDALTDSTISQKESNKIADEIGKLTSRQIQYNVDGKMIKEENLTLKQMLESLKIEKEFKASVENKNVAQVLNDFGSKYLKDLSVVKGKGLKDFAANIMSNKIAKTTSYFKTFKGYYGIVVALATLPISCGTLNWAYPRIVERFFPDIAHAKAKKGGNK